MIYYWHTLRLICKRYNKSSTQNSRATRSQTLTTLLEFWVLLFFNFQISSPVPPFWCPTIWDVHWDCDEAKSLSPLETTTVHFPRFGGMCSDSAPHIHNGPQWFSLLASSSFSRGWLTLARPAGLLLGYLLFSLLFASFMRFSQSFFGGSVSAPWCDGYGPR